MRTLITSDNEHTHAREGRTQQLRYVCWSARAGAVGRGEKHAFALIVVIISLIKAIYTRFNRRGLLTVRTSGDKLSLGFKLVT